MPDWLVIHRKKDDAVLLSVEAGQPYRLPQGVKPEDVRIQIFKDAGAAPVVSQPARPLEVRPCKVCAAATYWRGACCAEKAAGFRGGWVCPKCHHVTMVRKA